MRFRRGLKLNPITSLYYISPACFSFLLLPFLMFELPKIRNDPSVQINAGILFSNAAAAFGESPTPYVSFKHMEAAMLLLFPARLCDWACRAALSPSLPWT